MLVKRNSRDKQNRNSVGDNRERQSLRATECTGQGAINGVHIRASGSTAALWIAGADTRHRTSARADELTGWPPRFEFAASLADGAQEQSRYRTGTNRSDNRRRE